MRLHLTRAATFGPICQFLESGGSNVGRRLSQVGIVPDLMASPETLIPLRQCCQFVQMTIERDGVEDI